MILWIYGKHSVLKALGNPRRNIYEIRCIPSMQEEIRKHIQSSGIVRPNIRLTLAEESTLTRLTKGGVHQGITICCDPLPIEKKITKDNILPHSRVLVLDHLQDVGNLGAIMRSMLALNFTALITSQRGVPSLEQCSVKNATGAIEYLKIFQISNIRNAVLELKNNDFWCIGLDHRAKPVQNISHGKIAIVIGSEGAGLQPIVGRECDQLVSLKTNPEFPVLNAGVAAAIAMYNTTLC